MTRRAFTVVELAICLTLSLLVGACAMVVLPGTRCRCCSPSIKDSTQVRGIHQGLVMWAGNNSDRYPLPSQLDAADETIAAPAASKDTTANIISVLIYNGFFGPELCVSARESNPAIQQMVTYAYSAPATAAIPAKALWDPAFNADFTGGRTANFSYAHALPSGPRLADWGNTFDGNLAVVGNRGPQVSSVTRSGSLSTPSFNTKSNTLLIHGKRTSWQGNICYNDNHVNFETNLFGAATYKIGVTSFEDCLFFDEQDDPTGRNSLLGVFTRSGATPGEFAWIWD